MADGPASAGPAAGQGGAERAGAAARVEGAECGTAADEQLEAQIAQLVSSAAGIRGGSPHKPLGNRVWRVTLPGEGADGVAAILKLHDRRRSLLREAMRSLLAWLWRRKTLPTAAARRATEARLLQEWAAAGCDVPALLDPAAHGLAAGPGLWQQDLGGQVLLACLRPGVEGAPEARAALLSRFGAAWAHRHRLALTRDDPSFVLEHATLAHVLVAPGRMAWFDLEQTFLPGQPVLPLLVKEVLGCLRSLAKVVGAERLPADLDALLAGYADAPQLRAIVQAGLGAGGLVVSVDTSLKARKGELHDRGALLGELARALERAAAGLAS